MLVATHVHLLLILLVGVTALSAAALDGKMEAMRYLLDQGADPNKKDDAGSVPLHCAAKFGILLLPIYFSFSLLWLLILYHMSYSCLYIFPI
jgi:hypothetical protein